MSKKRVTFTKPAKDVLVKRKLDEEVVLNAINPADKGCWFAGRVKRDR